MKNTARIQKRLILLIAFSITWIFIGSLVIFHQEQVMGKSFKWNKVSFIVPKNKDEKSIAELKAMAFSDQDHQFILAVLDDKQREQLLAGQYCLLSQQNDERALPVFNDLCLALRAPPLA